jgi:chemotaxis family two-component system response regulator Rcp1
MMKLEPPLIAEIMIIEDNPGDVRLVFEALKLSQVRTQVTVATNGADAMEMLHCRGRYAETPVPDLILLDLHLPRKSGLEVLAEIKQDSSLQHIPVVIMTSSNADEDIRCSYQSHANCCVTKPVNLDEFMKLVKAIGDFWLSVARLPARELRARP